MTSVTTKNQEESQMSPKNCCAKNSSDTNLITDNVVGEILCQNCGRVLVEKIEERLPEYRIAENEDYFTKSRV